MLDAAITAVDKDRASIDVIDAMVQAGDELKTFAASRWLKRTIATTRIDRHGPTKCRQVLFCN